MQSSGKRGLAGLTSAAISWGITGAGGFVIGAALALIAKPTEPMFITSTWSYIPAEQWWLHGLLLGLTLALVMFALQLGVVLTVLLLRYRLLIGGVGLALALAGCGMVALALGAAGLDDGQRLLFGAAMGPGLGAFGLLMFVTDLRNRLRG